MNNISQAPHRDCIKTRSPRAWYT